jgi:hypothetical protein
VAASVARVSNLTPGNEWQPYDVVGQALLETLGQALGAELWTPAVENAWGDVFGVVAGVMRAGAEADEEESGPFRPPSPPMQSARPASAHTQYPPVGRWYKLNEVGPHRESARFQLESACFQPLNL